MKARVIKTGEIVALIDKQGDYFIDSNGSPYKDAELEFGIKDDTPAQTDPMASLTKMMQGKHESAMTEYHLKAKYYNKSTKSKRTINIVFNDLATAKKYIEENKRKDWFIGHGLEVPGMLMSATITRVKTKKKDVFGYINHQTLVTK